MNNKGFTLIELLISFAIISLITIITISIIQNTLALSDEKTYDIMKNNIIDNANTYILECTNNLIDCDREYTWNDNKTNFPVSRLIEHGYFYYNSLINPITKKDISDCLIVKVIKNEYNSYIISLDEDNC